jgi:hypothetical protein
LAKYRVLVILEASSLPKKCFYFLFHFLFLLIPTAHSEGDVIHHPIIDYWNQPCWPLSPVLLLPLALESPVAHLVVASYREHTSGRFSVKSCWGGCCDGKGEGSGGGGSAGEGGGEGGGKVGDEGDGESGGENGGDGEHDGGSGDFCCGG